MRRGLRRGLVAAGAVAGGVALLRRLGMFRVAVEGDSMSPSLEAGQFVVGVRARRIRRGDIVVVRMGGQLEMVKRVVGLPGERVEFDEGRVQVGNRLLREPYATGTGPGGVWDLGSGEFAVLGDDRDRSTDSRSFGPVPRDAIVGVVRFRYWPSSGPIR